MDFEFYERALKKEPFDEYSVRDILDKFFQNDRPFIFRENPDAHLPFKRRVSEAIHSTFGYTIHPGAGVFICGSAHLGFSVVPGPKFGRSFRPEASDIDVAIICSELFDRWWDQLAHPQTTLGIDQSDIAQDLLHGFISPNRSHWSTEIGGKWWEMFGRLEIQGFRKLRGRIYRNAQFMENYHRRAVIGGREHVLGDRRSGF